MTFHGWPGGVELATGQLRRWMTGATAVAVVAATALVGAPAAGAQAPRQTVTMTYTSTVPGTATGMRSTFKFQHPNDPNGRPYAVASLVTHGPPGGGMDTTVPPQCRASDAQLTAQGPAGCPAETKVGTGLAVSDTGGSGPFPRYTRTTITSFNNQGELVGVGVNEDIPAIKLIDRTKINGDGTTRTNFPMFPGPPPPEPYMPYRELHMDLPPYERGGRAYMRTPPTCPASGHWVTTHVWTYRDGVSQTTRSSSPCRPGGSRLAPCLSRRSPIGPRNIGRVRLGATRRALLALPVRTPRRARGSLRWCVARSRGTVVAVLDRRNRVVLVGTSARAHGNRGVQPGSRGRAMRTAYPRARKLGRGLFRAYPRSRRVVAVRRGRVRFVAVASSRLLRNRAALRRAVRRLDF